VTRQLAVAALACGCLCSGDFARADAWDSATQNDNSVGSTENELVQGTAQLHDLGAVVGVADKDYFRIRQEAYSSYEIVLDSTSGDIGPGTTMLQRVGALGGNLQYSEMIGAGIGYSLSLRWENSTSSPVTVDRILAQSAGCTTSCNSTAVYQIRAYETTYSVPRFNNSGSQVTTLLVQNPTSYSVTLHVEFWDATGAHIVSYPTTLAPKAILVLNTTTVPGLPSGSAGSITISNTARYGELSGKVVSTDTGTGFAFDTPMVPRIR
jgi:hypothetical protein